jgi:hypothetical protein
MACLKVLIKRHQDAALVIPLATMPGPVQGIMSDGRRVRVFLWGQVLLFYQLRGGKVTVAGTWSLECRSNTYLYRVVRRVH